MEGLRRPMCSNALDGLSTEKRSQHQSSRTVFKKVVKNETELPTGI